MPDVEEERQRGGHEEDQHRTGDDLRPAGLDEEPPEKDEERNQPDQGDLRIEMQDAVRNLRQQLERFLGVRGDAQRDVRLFRDDDHADRGEHAMHGGHREEFAQHAEAQRGEDDLHGAGHEADGEHLLIAHLLHAAQDDDDHARGGPLDREFGVAEERREQTADDGGEDACDRRDAGSDGDAQAERQRDEEDEETRSEVLGEVLAEAAEITDRRGSVRLEVSGRVRGNAHERMTIMMSLLPTLGNRVCYAFFTLMKHPCT